jgi:hypothetical protein
MRKDKNVGNQGPVAEGPCGGFRIGLRFWPTWSHLLRVLPPIHDEGIRTRFVHHLCDIAHSRRRGRPTRYSNAIVVNKRILVTEEEYGGGYFEKAPTKQTGNSSDRDHTSNQAETVHDDPDNRHKRFNLRTNQKAEVESSEHVHTASLTYGIGKST